MQGDSAAICARIEQALSDADAVLSVPDFARLIGEPLARVSYAFLRLEQLGKIEGAAAREPGARIAPLYRRVTSDPADSPHAGERPRLDSNQRLPT